MPSSLVKSFAKKSGKSIPEVEKIWGEVKKYAKDKFGVEDEKMWAYVNATVQKRLGLNEENLFVNMQSVKRTRFKNFAIGQ